MARTVSILFTLLGLSGLAASLSDEKVIHGEPEAVGTVCGTVTYRGKVPRARYPDDLGRQRPLLQVNDKTGALQYAVVYLERADGGNGVERKDEASASRDSSEGEQQSQQSGVSDPVVVDQRDMSFMPHLIAVRAGQTVAFTNSDAANHNVRSTSLDRRNQFNVLTPTGGSYKRAFVADPKGRPIRLGCEIHAWMRAWVYVFDHPYFDVTDRAGSYAIENVPPGNYRLELRQPDVGLQASREIHAGEPVTIDFHFTEADLKLGR